VSPTIGDLLNSPPTVPLWPTAARALGIGRNAAYALAERDEFPVRVFKLGRPWTVPTADLLAYLGIDARALLAPVDARESHPSAA
jgi:hypothetical protein